MDTFYLITCWVHNRKGPSYIVELRDREDNFILRRQDEEDGPIEDIRGNGRIDNNKPFTNKVVSRAIVEDLLEKLNNKSMPLVPKMTGGFDGVNYHIRIRNGESLAHFSWWLDCPKEWSILQQFWEKVIELSRNS